MHQAIGFGCMTCGTVHSDYVRSVNCCTWVEDLQEKPKQYSRYIIDSIESALRAGLSLSSIPKG